MTTAELLLDSFDRVREVVRDALDGLTPEQLSSTPAPEANSIAWLAWHLTRVQDDHVATAFGRTQVWLANGWMERFALPFDATATGYGHSPDEVAKLHTTADLLVGYYDDVHEQTKNCLAGLTDADLDRVVDPSFDPPVTLGVRLVSVLSDDLQHAGQLGYVRGLVNGDKK